MPAQRPGSSLDRLLGVIDLFEPERPVWTLDEISSASATSRATTYRYVKELADSGLLARIGKGGFVLGPRIIELDRQIRLCDPLLAVGRDVLDRAIVEIGNGVLLLSGRYDEQFICTYAAPENADIKVTYSRGKTLPRFTGSTSLTILAHLPRRVLLKLFLHHRQEIAEAGLGAEWDEFSLRLADVRRAGIWITKGAIDPGTICTAVPLFYATRHIIGALCLVQRDRGRGVPAALQARMIEIGQEISRKVSKLGEADKRPLAYLPSVPQSVVEATKKSPGSRQRAC